MRVLGAVGTAGTAVGTVVPTAPTVGTAQEFATGPGLAALDPLRLTVLTAGPSLGTGLGTGVGAGAGLGLSGFEADDVLREARA